MHLFVRVFIPTFAVGVALLMALFYWMAETASGAFWLLGIIGGAAIGLLALITARRNVEGTARQIHMDLALRLAVALGIFAVIGLGRYIGGALGFVMLLVLGGLVGAVVADLRYHMLPAYRPPTSGWLRSPLLIRELNLAWSLRVLAAVFAVEIALVAVTQSYTFSPCSWPDLTRRLAGCVGVINHAEPLNDSAYAPNGKFAATADREGVLRVWALPARKLAYTLGDYRSEIAQASSTQDRLDLESATLVRFSADSAMLASSAPDLKIRLWNVADGSLLRTLQGHTDYVRALVFSPDGTVLASASGENVIHLWRVQDGALLRTIESPDVVHSLVFSPDGSLLLGAERVTALHLWRVQDGTLVRTINTEALLGPAIFSPDGQLIAAEDSQHQIGLWRVSDGTLARTLGRHGDYIQALAFSSDGTLLASGAGLDDRDARLWRVSDGSLVQTIELRFGADDLDFSADGSLLAIDSFESLYFWRVR
ncbi:MAG TPA: WD40 repeat domain-containing protein [Herpetosiphonaceae bacterium]